MARAALTLLLLPAIFAAGPAAADDPPQLDRTPGTIEVSQAGLSGLAIDGDGVIWAVPERERRLVPLRRDGDRLVPAGSSVPIEGVPRAHDTEAIAWLPDGRVALGTETRRPRTGDEILLARRDGDVFRVDDRIVLPYAPWKLDAHPNKGIEGLCFASGHLVAGLEMAMAQGRTRHGPIAVYSPEGKTWTAYRLHLTSSRGKLAALTCRATDDGIEVRAIERHFGTSHLLGFTIALPPREGVIEPEMLGSLYGNDGAGPNFEAMAWLANGDLAIVADNHYGRVTGPIDSLIVSLEPEEPPTAAGPKSAND